MILKPDYDCIVIGAGISGLSLARRLTLSGLKVLVVEKSKGVGGRIATRRDGAATYDHGAQFYKIPHESHWQLNDHWVQSNLSQPWFKDEKTVYMASPGGMTHLAKNLAQEINISFEEKVLAIHQAVPPNKSTHALEIVCESGRYFSTKNVVISAPLPQATELLQASNIEYPTDLNSIEYASALVGLLEVSSESDVVHQLEYLKNVNDEIFSISNQLSKKVSASLAFTVVMQPEWSRKKFATDDSVALPEIVKAFSANLEKLGASVSIQKQQLKKWRFSHPTTTYSEPHVVAGLLKNIFLMGDAFGGPSIVGAVKSADSITTDLLKL